MPDTHAASLRRIAFRAALLVAPLVALAFFAPRIIDWLKHRGDAPAARAAGDRAPTPEELEASRVAEVKLAEAEKRWDKSTAITPSDAVADDSGERTRWFQGFGLSVETKPSGARVLVNGEDKGQSPLVTSVDCSPGDEVRIEVRRAGQKPQHRTTRCRKDLLVEVEFR